MPAGSLDFDAWAAGLKDGRSYVGDGKSQLAGLHCRWRAGWGKGTDRTTQSVGSGSTQYSNRYRSRRGTTR